MNRFKLLIITLLLNFTLNLTAIDSTFQWSINTSNPAKLQDYERLFNDYHLVLQSTAIDLDEIDADPVLVVAHKASQMEDHVLVDDTSLDIEGANVGINLRWVADHLEEYIGRRAVWTVLLAYREGERIYVFQGQVQGSLVHPVIEKGYGFEPIFLPDGATQTLAESKTDDVNARALAVQAFLEDEPLAIVARIVEWDGPWQNPDEF